MSKTDPDHSQTDTDPDLLVGPTNIGPDLGHTDNSPGQADTGPDLGHTDNSLDPGQADTGPDLGPTDTGPDPGHTDNSPDQGQAYTGPDPGQDLGYKGKTRKVLHDIQCLKKVSLFG